MPGGRSGSRTASARPTTTCRSADAWTLEWSTTSCSPRFTSPVPILRRGGHSQAWDAGADAVGAFFGRLRIAVDIEPGFEATLDEAGPAARYAAFVRDRTERRRPDARMGWSPDEVQRLLRVEASRLRTDDPDAWDAAGAILARTVPR